MSCENYLLGVTSQGYVWCLPFKYQCNSHGHQDTGSHMRLFKNFERTILRLIRILFSLSGHFSIPYSSLFISLYYFIDAFVDSLGRINIQSHLSIRTHQLDNRVLPMSLAIPESKVSSTI